MNEGTKATAAPTLAEKLGIEYKEVDGFYYPVLEETEENEFLKLGKWGHRWLGLMMEHDRYLYNLYFMGGVLYQKAKEYEGYAWQLHDELVVRKVILLFKNQNARWILRLANMRLEG